MSRIPSSPAESAAPERYTAETPDAQSLSLPMETALKNRNRAVFDSRVLATMAGRTKWRLVSHLFVFTREDNATLSV